MIYLSMQWILTVYIVGEVFCDLSMQWILTVYIVGAVFCVLYTALFYN